MTRKYDIATAPRRDSKRWKQGTTTWDELRSWAENPADHKGCGNYLLGKLRGGVRNKASVESRSMLALDVDKASADFPERYELLAGWKALLHTTFQSSPEAPRWRVLIPVDRTLDPDEYAWAVNRLMDMLGREQFDTGSAEPERYMFRPAAADPSRYRWHDQDGPVATAEELLQGYAEHVATREAPRANRTKRDPLQVEGTVGAFNRAYPLEKAIETFGIPYEPAEGDRWHLVGASTAAGISRVSESLLFSHHANDPAHGQTCSAFDLVRLHRFGHLDEDAAAGTPVNRLPSHTAMLEFASQDPGVLQEIIGTDFGTPPEGDAPPDLSWRLGLRRNPRTGNMVDTVSNWDLIRDNEPLFRELYFNEFTLAIETTHDLPWRPLSRGGETFTDTDRVQLAFYLEREFSIRPTRALVDAVVEATAQQRFVNPVREYLLGLEWDGTPRLETALPGAKPTPYNRMVARKVLTAAVARVLDPGVKWDHMLVLHGREGVGKTTWVERMARGYSAPLGRIGDKDTLLTLQRSWIVTSDEGYTLRKGEADAQKEFITRTVDVLRRPYEREVRAHPRHCVIWGTTNDQTFLKKQEGNRRFLIVRCEEKTDLDALTPEYVDQVWAEALHLYRAGEKLYLTDEEYETSKAERADFEEEDDLEGVILHYVDRLVPDNWDELSPDARVEWLQAADAGLEKGTQRIEEVCSLQVWVEALRQPLGRRTRRDLLDISKTLQRLPGWKAGQPGRMANYGPQKRYVRE